MRWARIPGVIGAPGADALVVLLGVGLAVAGAAGLYLASPNQCWRVAPLPARSTRALAVALLTASLLSFSRVMQVVPAVFTLVSLLMLLLVSFPYVGVLVARRLRG
jgi:hypothetical protein